MEYEADYQAGYQQAMYDMGVELKTESSIFGEDVDKVAAQTGGLALAGANILARGEERGQKEGVSRGVQRGIGYTIIGSVLAIMLYRYGTDLKNWISEKTSTTQTPDSGAVPADQSTGTS